MILKTEQDLTCRDMEVLIRYAKRNRRLERLIDASDLYCIESVDKKTFVYLEESVCRTDFRLYQLTDELEHLGFVQISKSCILNINFLESIKTLGNSRMEAALKNGERLHVTRKYLNGIKQALQGGVNI